MGRLSPQAAAPEREGHCRNCEAALPDAARFCPDCGQSTRIFTRPWNQVLRELLDELFDFDGRMVSSLRLLMTRPGRLSLDYNQGRRRAHTPPLRMYLVISLAFFFVLPMILPESPGATESHQFSVDLYSKGMFLSLPLYALLLKLFYRDHFFLSHLVFTTYLFSFMFIVFGFMLALESAADRHLALALLQVAVLIYMTAYFVMALKTCYGGSWGRSLLKALGLLMIFLPILGFTIEAASHSEVAIIRLED